MKNYKVLQKNKKKIFGVKRKLKQLVYHAPETMYF